MRQYTRENRQQHSRDGENITKIDYQNKRRVDWKEWNLMWMLCWWDSERRSVLWSVYLGTLSALISICTTGDVIRECAARTKHDTYTHQFKWAFDGKFSFSFFGRRQGAEMLQKFKSKLEEEIEEKVFSKKMSCLKLLRTLQNNPRQNSYFENRDSNGCLRKLQRKIAQRLNIFYSKWICLS